MALPGVVHGFTTRAGGVSAGAFASLNLGRTFGGGDDPARIRDNLARVQSALGVTELVTVLQVHGDRIVDDTDVTAATEADAVVVRTPGVAALVTVADCAPVLIARRDGLGVAAVHAGWRGAVARIASSAVRALGTAEVVAAVGPCIRACCFEVGPEVVDAARALAGESAVVQRGNGQPHVDLQRIVVEDLVQAGVPRGSVDVVARCSRCEADAFFSHRREAGFTGRQAGVIGLAAR